MTRPAGVELTVNEHPSATARVIYLGVPTFGMVSIRWHAHLMQLQTPLNRSVFHAYGQGFEVGQARNYLVQQALDWKNPAGHTVESVFFVDDDVLIPPHALMTLMAHNRPIVSGLYYAKTRDPQPLLLPEPFAGTPPVPKNQLVECYAHGMGCTLIKLHVFRELLDQGLVEYETLPNGQRLPQFYKTTRDKVFDEHQKTVVYNETEDVHFLKLAAKLGYPATVDTGLFCWHWDSSQQQAYPLSTWQHYRATGEIVLPGHETAVAA